MTINAKNVADYLLSKLQTAIAKKGTATLVVSGGSSPIPVFEALVASEFDWENVVITLVDERAVASDHADSNHKLVLDHLLCGKVAKASFIPLYDNLAEYDKISDCDVILLGMGTDGHFASLFPNMIGDETAFGLEAVPQIITTGPNGNPEHPRISMNLRMIANCENVCVLLPNAEKIELFENARKDVNLPVHYLQKALGERLVIFS